eukprot:CAMPEP_0170491662 /NCGR_PEP_ID=MMETSP0208-20121228/11179_1 /TAXON_ID=197538 /ORGANISM="Strombidium inclinatum, Strain S3" /LENGTH=60 /DNA_ID=CAMNT_0010767277 /DNA_START=979 /DNA_END=1161 /DNA_ORIENTATION=+
MELVQLLLHIEWDVVEVGHVLNNSKGVDEDLVLGKNLLDDVDVSDHELGGSLEDGLGIHV